MEMIKSRRDKRNERKAYTVYTATFKDGTEMTFTEYEGFRNRLDVYNFICGERLGKGHGGLEEITCRPMHA